MRIGFITQEYPPELIGGAGTYAHRLVSCLAGLGHEVVVFTPLTSGKRNAFQSCERIKVVPITIPPFPFSMAFYWLKMRDYVRREEETSKFDIIHINGPTFWFPGKKIASAPHVLTIHHLSRDSVNGVGSEAKLSISALGGENSLIVRYFEGRCVHVVDSIITVSNYTRGRLKARYASEAEKAVTIYEAHDTPPPYNSGAVQTWRKKLGIGSEKILLFVGRLNDPRKGLDLLIKAISTRPDLCNCDLLVVGKGDPLPVEKMVKSYGLKDRVKLLGFVKSSELWELYHLCDLYVVPSRLEGFGLTVLDAAAAGKRIVATRVGAIPEIGGPGTTLVEPDDPIALADAISSALLDDSPLTEAILEHASHFNWSKVARATEQVYSEARATSQ